MKEYDKRLKSLQGEIDRLKTKIKKAGIEGNLEIRQQVDQLDQRAKQARIRFDELKESSGTAWEELKRGFESALEELESAQKKAASHF